jgi:hypothetical protein
MSRFELEEIKLPETYDKKGKGHSYNDLPSYSGIFGVYWRKHGIFHRENNKPSSVYFDGVLWWCTEDKFIKEEWADGFRTSNEITWEDGNAQI